MATTTINDALVELDKLIDATNYLLEELNTRKDKFLTEDLATEIKTQMEGEHFKRELYSYMKNGYGAGICREVAHYVMENIDNSIEKFINSRVETAMQAAMEKSNR
jgi:hypothetical protein